MKFKNEFLKKFQIELENKISNKNTMEAYLYEIRKAFKNQEFSNLKDFDYKKLKNHTENIINKRSASTLKCSLKLFSNVFPEFKFNENKEFFEEQISKKSNHRTTRFSKMNMLKTFKNINFIKDDKKRLAYRTILATGLRIDELSNLKKKDITIKDDKVFVFVEKGKYGKQRTVEALKDIYLKNSLNKFIENLDNDDRIFYSKKYSENIATKKRFMCHDLRRAFSQILLKDLLDSGITKAEAIEELKKRLGHEEDSTTYKKYLSRKIDFSKTKWE
ncbi:MAG: site-specific integrase [Clostridiales bacterium]